MHRMATALLAQETDPEKCWQRLCQIHRELSQLRRDDHQAARTVILRERWDWQIECEAEEAHQRQNAAETKRRILMLLDERHRQTNAEMLFGGGASGRHKSELLYRLKSDLPMDDLLDGTWDAAQAAGPQTSDPTPANETPSPEPELGGQPASAVRNKSAKSQASSLIKPRLNATPTPAVHFLLILPAGQQPVEKTARWGPRGYKTHTLL